MTMNLIVTPEAVVTAGSISYWRLSGPVDLAKLTDAWKQQQLPFSLLPTPPSDETALGRAVKEEAEKRRLVRPLARRGAWAIVQEVTIGEHLDYTTLLTVRARSVGPMFAQEGAPLNVYTEITQRITDNYNRHRTELAPEDIGTWLVDLTKQHNAVGLRDTGGIYFVPRAAVDFWGKVVAAIESCSAHRVFRIPAMKNSEAVDAITDAITQEAEATVQQMMGELQELGQKALATRRKACEALLSKVSAYDNLLGVQLRCRERVEELQAAVAAAALLAEAA